jgi:hypothetical protein
MHRSYRAPGAWCLEAARKLMAKKRDQASKGGKLSLEERIARYLASGRNELTPKQIRRAAHKAHVATDQVRARVGNS